MELKLLKPLNNWLSKIGIKPPTRSKKGAKTPSAPLSGTNSHLVENKADKRYFKVNDLVETPTGEVGKVWKVYRSIESGQVISCSVAWIDKYQGKDYSFFLPAEDKGRKFNPAIRLCQPV